MSFSNGFLQVCAAVKRPAGISKVNERGLSQYSYLSSNQRKRTPSSIDAYSAQCSHLSIKQIIHEKYLALEKRKQKSLPHTLPAPKNSFLVQNTNHERVAKTIDSVNQYAEQLRLTLIRQYKAQKMKSRRRAKGSEEPLASAAEFESAEDAGEGKVGKTREEASRNPAYKTLNLLYQAIIDNSFRNRKKDDFELQAVRLPIVDRFNNRTETLRIERELNSKCKYDHTHRPELSPLDPASPLGPASPLAPKAYCCPLEKTKTTFHTHKAQVRRQQAKSHRLAHDDSEIIPWSVPQQSLFY